MLYEVITDALTEEGVEKVLKRLRESSRENVAALRLELRAQQGCGSQEEVDRISRRLKKHGVAVAAEMPVAEVPRNNFV